MAIIFDGELAKYPEELFRIAFDVAKNLNLFGTSASKGGVDIRPEMIRGIHELIRIRIVESKLRIDREEDGSTGYNTDSVGIVGYVSIQPKIDGGCRVTIEQLSDPQAIRSEMSLNIDKQPIDSATFIRVITDERYDRALWFENYVYLFLLQADSTHRAAEWLHEIGYTNDFIKKVRFENGHLQLLDGYTMEHYLADREKSLARQKARMKELGTEPAILFVGKCKNPQRLIKAVEAFVIKRLPLHFEGKEPSLHSGSVKRYFSGVPEQYEIRAVARGLGEWPFGQIEVWPVNDIESNFELTRYGNEAPDSYGFDYQTIHVFFDELATYLRHNYQEVQQTEITPGVNRGEPLSSGLALQAKKFFITHSWSDSAFTNRLCDDLRSNGLNGFLDVYSIKPGDKIPSEIAQGLEECEIYLPILSFAALNSLWCKEEIDAAIMLSNSPGRNGRPRIIPILIENCQDVIPIFLKVRLYINFVNRYDDALRELLTKGFGLSIAPPAP